MFCELTGLPLQHVSPEAPQLCEFVGLSLESMAVRLSSSPIFQAGVVRSEQMQPSSSLAYEKALSGQADGAMPWVTMLEHVARPLPECPATAAAPRPENHERKLEDLVRRLRTTADPMLGVEECRELFSRLFGIAKERIPASHAEVVVAAGGTVEQVVRRLSDRLSAEEVERHHRELFPEATTPFWNHRCPLGRPRYPPSRW